MHIKLFEIECSYRKLIRIIYSNDLRLDYPITRNIKPEIYDFYRLCF